MLPPRLRECGEAGRYKPKGFATLRNVKGERQAALKDQAAALRIRQEADRGGSPALDAAEDALADSAPSPALKALGGIARAWRGLTR